MTLVASFYNVAKHGSLRATAREGFGSIPTLSRHIGALEEAYGIRLFDRRGEGLHLTETGVELFEYAEAVYESGLRFAAAAQGERDEITGTVRLSASPSIAFFVMPPVVAKLVDFLPEIHLDLVVSEDASNLLVREADIAVRLFDPDQMSLIAKRIGTMELAPYASHEYVAKFGSPQTLQDLAEHILIGSDNSAQINAQVKAIGLQFTADFFKYRCNDFATTWQMVLEGCGIGFGLRNVADSYEAVVRVLPNISVFERPVWLTSHAELKTSARVRLVYDFLSAELATVFR